ncbi:MAG: hypothetical protein ACYSPI_13575 [Planctomycetota bacterium]
MLLDALGVDQHAQQSGNPKPEQQIGRHLRHGVPKIQRDCPHKLNHRKT